MEIASDRAAYAGKLLGDLGADVIVVEPPGGHASRSYGPFVDDEPDPDQCLWWWNYNTSKRSVVLDLDTDDGQRRLPAARPRRRHRARSRGPRGVGRRSASTTTRSAPSSPELIWVSVTPFGQARAPSSTSRRPTSRCSPGRGWCGRVDTTITDLPPMRPSGNHAQHTASVFAVLGALTAVLHRDLTGTGQHVDVSMHAALNVSTEVTSVDWLFSKSTLQRQTGRHASAQPTMGIQVPAADGRFVTTPLALTSAKNFHAALEWLRELELEERVPRGVLPPDGSRPRRRLDEDPRAATSREPRSTVPAARRSPSSPRSSPRGSSSWRRNGEASPAGRSSHPTKRSTTSTSARGTTPSPSSIPSWVGRSPTPGSPSRARRSRPPSGGPPSSASTPTRSSEGLEEGSDAA